MSTALSPRPRSDGSVASVSAGAGPARLTALPILILYPHSRCNCRCVMCDIWRPGHRDELAAEDVRREAGSWRAFGVRRVVLSGGEPLMHQDLRALVEPLASEGIAVTLLTTGLLLERHAAWISALVDDVIVSLDGPPEVHDAVRRVPRAFERLAEGVHALRTQPAVPRITARCTLQRANVSALAETVDAAHRLALDGISFLAVDTHSEAFNRPGGPSADAVAGLLPTMDQIAGLRRQVDALSSSHAADFAAGFIAESPAKLRRLADHLAASRGEGAFPPVRCNAPWVSAVVEADGTLRPCFFHRAIGRWEDHDASSGGLPTAINGPQAIAFREGLVVAENDICRRCVCSLFLGSDDVVPML